MKEKLLLSLDTFSCGARYARPSWFQAWAGHTCRPPRLRRQQRWGQQLVRPRLRLLLRHPWVRPEILCEVLEYGHWAVQWSSFQNRHLITPSSLVSLSLTMSFSLSFSESSLLATKFIQISSATTVIWNISNKIFWILSSHYHYLRIGSGLVTLEHSKRGHKLGNHLPLYLVGSDHLDLLAILVEHVLSDDLGVSLHLLGWWRQGGAVSLLYLISPATSNWFWHYGILFTSLKIDKI